MTLTTTRAVAISKQAVKQHAAKISASKQKLDDQRMAHATLWDNFEEDGGNKSALKAVLKLKNQDVAKTRDWQFHFDFYAELFGLNDQDDAIDDLGAEDGSAAGDGAAADMAGAPA